MLLEAADLGKCMVRAVGHFGFYCKNHKTSEETNLTNSCIAGTMLSVTFLIKYEGYFLVP